MSLQIADSAANRIDASWRPMRPAQAEERGTERNVPPSLSLDTDGFIRECSTSVESLFGYRQNELMWQHIACLFPKLAETALVRDDRVNPMLGYICHCDHVFEAISKQGRIINCHLNFFVIKHSGMSNLRMIVRPISDTTSKVSFREDGCVQSMPV